MPAAPDKADLLQSLIRDRAVRALFQPIVDLNDGSIVGFEALCRPLADRGFSGADELFAAADDLGLAWQLEQLARDVALESAARWPRDLRLFLNISPTVLADERFTHTLRHDLARALPPDQVVLEITERSSTDLGDRLLRQADLAKQCGFSVAVDDAGAGTSGLNRMMQIRPHWIKLDRQLVAGIDQDMLRQNLIRSFVHFARMSGVSVIAEGIEKPAELAALMGLGIHFGQGYFLGRPADLQATLDPGTAVQVRQRWASVEANSPAEPHTLPMVRLCTSVPVIESGSTPIADAVLQLARHPDLPGIVLKEGRRLVGWCDRRHLQAAACGPDARRPVSTIARPVICALTPSATVVEALQFACTREDDDLAQPIIIAAGPEIIGIVPMRELLRAAASDARPGIRPLFECAAPPACSDHHLQEMLARAGDPNRPALHSDHADAAFIDIRRFTDYNAALGDVLGDKLIAALGDLLASCVVRESSDVFLAHLGDDRFMVTAPAGVLVPRLRLLTQSFERSFASIAHPARAGRASAPRLGLRVLHLPDIFHRAAHPREIFRVEQQLRQKARNLESAIPPGHSILVTDERTCKAAARLSA